MILLSYNFVERINRVINNHQFTCQHLSHYLFVLKGFDAFIDKISINVKKFDSTDLGSRKNYYLTYSEALLLDDKTVQELKDNNYDVWIVDFNLIPNTWIVKENDELKFIDSFDPLDFVEERKTLSIFNTTNSLTGIVDDPNTERTIEDYLQIMKELL